MRLLSKRFQALIAVGACALALGAVGCGGDDDNQNPDAAVQPDGPQADAPIDPNTLRSGTIAILDAKVTNPGMEYSGAAVSITYTDLTAGDVPPAYGEASAGIGQCSVKLYIVGTDNPPLSVDEGDVTIEDTLSPIGTCSFDDTLKRYRCPAGSGTVTESSTVGPGGNGTMTLSLFNSNPFAGMDVVGMYVEFEGFNNPLYNGMFPVINNPADDTLIVANPAAAAEDDESVAAGQTPTFTFYAGEGPTPANRDFLGDDTNTIAESKAAGDVVADFSGTLKPSGEGLVLADESVQPHQLPTTAQDVTFTCDGTNGDCGAAGGFIYGFVLTGETTDADLTGTLPNQMPDATEKRVTFTCVGTPGASALTLPQGAMEVILNSNPTRIRTQLMRITADQGKPQTTVIAGHALVGFTDIPQQ